MLKNGPLAGRQAYYLELFKNRAGRWCIRLMHTNGNKILFGSPRGYSSKTKARKTADGIVDNISGWLKEGKDWT